MRVRAARKGRVLGAGMAIVVGLALASSTAGSVALAGGQTSAEHVQSRYWLVRIGDRVAKVPANGTVIYCAGEFVENMTPRLVLGGSGAGPHYYAYHILDPSGQRSINIYASFNGPKSVIDRPFQPLNWAKAEERESNPPFPVGTYTLQVALNAQIIGGLPKGGKMKAIETLRLKPKKGKGC